MTLYLRSSTLLHSLLLFLFCTTALFSSACINEYGTSLNGTVTYSEAGGGAPPPRELDQYALRKKCGELLSEYHKTGNLEAWSDHGAKLLYLHEYEAGKQVFIALERRDPGHYATAANLGTAYELLGNIDSAYYWMSRAVDIYPGSHGGSEWIHLKILEAKRNGTFENGTSVLELDFGQSDKPAIADAASLYELRNQIYGQLYERMYFIKPPNAIMGSLLFDLGNASAIIYNTQSALDCYKAAADYGFESELLDSRIRTMRLLSARAWPFQALDWMVANPRTTLTLGFLGLVLLVILLRIGYKRWQARKGSSQSIGVDSKNGPK